jgi:hypothetical protein
MGRLVVGWLLVPVSSIFRKDKAASRQSDRPRGRSCAGYSSGHRPANVAGHVTG